MKRKKGKNLRSILAIDPGTKGAVVFKEGAKLVYHLLPLNSEKEIDFEKTYQLLLEYRNVDTVYIERPFQFGMGMKQAFGYGKTFGTLEACLKLIEVSYVYVEPSKWAKVCHAGIDANLKAKAKSQIAVRRFYPKSWGAIPTTDKKGLILHDGIVDALLIAYYAETL